MSFGVKRHVGIMTKGGTLGHVQLSVTSKSEEGKRIAGGLLQQ